MVTETVCRVPLEDLQTIRIRCEHCKKVAELAIRDLAGLHRDGCCKFCDEHFFSPDQNDPFKLLASALNALTRIRKDASIEFVIAPNATGSTKA